MKKLFLFAFLVFALTGLLTPSLAHDAYSEKGGNDKSQGDPQGCDNNKGKDVQQNPNCGDSTGGSSFSECDTTGAPDGKISAQELADHMSWPDINTAVGVILTIESSIKNNTPNTYIDTSAELRELNRTIELSC